MRSNDNELNQRINAYMENKYQRYVTWYGQNANLAKNNLIAAFVVVMICVLSIVFFPSSVDQMSFFQYKFDPTNAIKLGLFASIVLAIVSMFTTFKRRSRCLAINAQLQSELFQFQERDKDDAGVRDEAAFDAFKSHVDAIMAASNPEVVAAVELDNDQKEKSP